MEHLLNYQDIKFASLFFLWVGMALSVLVIFIRIWFIFKTTRHGIGFTETGYSFKEERLSLAKGIRFIRVFIVIAIILLTSSVLAGPYTNNFDGAIKTEKVEKFRTAIAVVDISGSMRFPFKDRTNNSNNVAIDIAEENREPKFNVVRDSLIELLESSDNLRVGVVFYSDKAISFRMPTRNVKALSEDLKNQKVNDNIEEWLEDKYFGFGEQSLQLLADGTKTVTGLKEAGDMFISLDMTDEDLRKSSSIILFTDLQDNLMDVVEKIESFTGKGVRVYVIAAAHDSTKKTFLTYLRGNNLVRLFDVNNESDVRNAFEEIRELETVPFVVEETIVLQKNLTFELAWLLMIIFGIFLIISEGIFTQVRGGVRK